MKKNVIAVMLDSLQFNYLGCYGNSWIKTPNIDKLAREGVLFENNYIEGLPTVPCRRSMLCGRYYLHSKGWSALDMDDTTIADLCWGQPIDTALIFDCPMYRLPKFGYTRGYDKVHFIHGHEADHDFYRNDPLMHLDPMDYIEQNVLDAADSVMGEKVIGPLIEEIECYLKHRQYWTCEEDQNAPRIMKKAVEYLKEVDRNKQFFLWIDSFDPHEPWDPPSVYDPDLRCQYDPDYKGKDMFLPILGHVKGIYTEPQQHHIRMLYAEKVTMVDRWVGYLMKEVRRLGLEDNTLVLLLSDHGEPMGNGEHGHGIMRKCRPWPYEELVHAPMIIRGPGLPSNKRIYGFTQSCDIAPTITDWLGLGVHPLHQGKSLLPLANGEVDKIHDFAVTGYFRYSASIITEDYSFIHWTREEEKTDGQSCARIYGDGITEHSAHLVPMLKGNDFTSAMIKANAGKSEAEIRLKEAATLDGEDQWTCTPGSVAELPENDCFFDRKADPFQLKNIIKKDEKKAKEQYDTLREFLVNLEVC